MRATERSQQNVNDLQPMSCHPFHGLSISYNSNPGAHAPGFMLPPASQAHNFTPLGLIIERRQTVKAQKAQKTRFVLAPFVPLRGYVARSQCPPGYCYSQTP
jgi:hypothetical protein